MDTDSIVTLNLDKEQPNKQKIFCDLPKPTKKYLFNTYENNGLLLVKSWKRPVVVAPEQSRLEIYLSPEKGFAELEVQGNYGEIKPGEFVDLIVFWQLMPDSELEKQLNLLQ